MKCTKCGAVIREGSKFCVQCGEKIENNRIENSKVENIRTENSQMDNERIENRRTENAGTETSQIEKKFGCMEEKRERVTPVIQKEERDKVMNHKTEQISEKKNIMAVLLNIVATIYLVAVVYSGCGMIGGNVQDILNYLLLNIVIIVLLYGLAQVVQLLTDIKNKMNR